MKPRIFRFPLMREIPISERTASIKRQKPELNETRSGRTEPRPPSRDLRSDRFPYVNKNKENHLLGRLFRSLLVQAKIVQVRCSSSP
uniref:Uncharacterized protein n=1 Tax=Leptospirillum ferrodiazotrophum TaxID=412449 RepID=C6I0D9_9BACT|nr:MAG: hypothetical protein UBAL3_95680031 [Leptospirillum ferrodiazotrophum]